MDPHQKKLLPFTDEEVRRYARQHPTPFHVYDETIIRDTCRAFKDAFSWNPGFKNYYAVKAAPNPRLLAILKEEGCGADCSSLPEVILAESVGMKGEEIMFTSNNTPLGEFKKAKDAGAILNLDDITHLDFVNDYLKLPETISFRYNPGEERHGNVIIGEPKEAKYGLTKPQLIAAYKKAKEAGVKKFGLHTMIVSNCIKLSELEKTAEMMFDLAVELHSMGIVMSFINLGGGIGVNYRPGERPIDFDSLGRAVETLYKGILVSAGLEDVQLFYECGRVITGPAGFMVTRVIHQKDTYKKYIGVDACMTNLMRPGLYGANCYHHITHIKEHAVPPNLPHKRYIFEDIKGPQAEFDVVGSLCENNDKFAVNRKLNKDIQIGDLLVLHDTGAHGHAMGFNYNGKLKSAEFLRKTNGELEQIRRAETLKDLFSTLPRFPGTRGCAALDSPCVRAAALAVGALMSGLLIGVVSARRFGRK